MMSLFPLRVSPRVLNAALLALERGLVDAPAATPLLLATPPRRTTAPLPRRFFGWHSTAMPQPLALRPDPTPWQWRTHPSWSKQSPFAYQAPRAAMAGLASASLSATPRAGGFALGGADDFDPIPEVPTATPVPTADYSDSIPVPEATTPALSQEQRALLPTATDDFREVREQELLFVDKSGLISEVLRDSTKASLITRPRRSGKSLNMTMLRCFLDQRYQQQSAEWFKGLEVMQDEVAVAQMGKHSVVFLDLKSAGASDYGVFLQNLAKQMLTVYESFSHLQEISKASEVDAPRKYREMLSDLGTIARRGVPLDSDKDTARSMVSTLQSSLVYLTYLLETSTGQKAWILIDEYDAPIQRGYSAKQQFHEEAIEFMKDFLGGALKGNPHLHKAVMTGVMRVSLASLFSGANNVEVHSTLEPRYSSYFGFTEPEVSHLLHLTGGKQSYLSEVRRWYNGYTIGQHTLYNPVSLIYYIRNNFKTKAYWVGTGQESQQDGHDLLSTRIRSLATLHHGRGLRVLRRLMTPNPDKEGYRSVILAVNPIATYGSKTICDDIWSLMLQSGYLTSRGEVRIGEGLDEEMKYQLAIPNQEVGQVFRKIVRTWFDQDFGIDAEFAESVASLLKADQLENLCTMLQAHLQDVSSVYDFSKRMQYEESYHISMLFMSVMLQNIYLVESNRETGVGRADITLTPKEPKQEFLLDQSRRGVVIELKVVGKAEDLQGGVDQALRQIVTKDYSAKLKRLDIKGIAHIGLAFCGDQMAFGVERYTLDRTQGVYVREEQELVIDGTARAKGEHAAQIEAQRSDDKSRGR